MPAKIDHNLIPAVIRDSVDPEILNRAQSIEWSINRDVGEDEHGFLDGSHEDYLSSQNLMHKSHFAGKNGHDNRKLEWCENNAGDSGYEYSPTSPSLAHKQPRSVSSLSYADQQVDLSALDETVEFGAGQNTNSSGNMKHHPMGRYPFPIYKVNQEQLKGDVVFEVAPRAAPGERTVHFEKSSRILNEEEMSALGIDSQVFGPNSKATMDEREEEIVQTSVLKGGPGELDNICRSMGTDAGDYFERQRARSVSPVGNKNPIQDEQSEYRKCIIFGSVDEIDNREQEFYPYRDAHQGKPLPGDNEFGTWGSRYDEKKQWKLCNGQWIRVAEPKPKPKPPQAEKYLAERVKCKPPKRIEVVRGEPVETVRPQSGSIDTDLDTDSDTNSEPASVDVDDSQPLDSSSSPQRPLLDRSLPLGADRLARRPPTAAAVDDDEPIEALKDRYRPKTATRPSEKDDTKLAPKPTGTILLEPIRPPTPPLEEIKVEPKQHTYVRMKKPLVHEGEEEKMMEDPNLLWMRMGPAQFGPPFGTMGRRKKAEEEWVGPPCELCHKQIEERRCMLAENMKFHCWHFACSFCLKTLKPSDFLIAEADRKPYCLNCHKREFPEIPLTNLELEKEGDLHRQCQAMRRWRHRRRRESV